MQFLFAGANVQRLDQGIDGEVGYNVAEDGNASRTSETVARDRILVQADLYDSTWLQHPWGDNLPFNLGLHKLQVDKDVPVHGAIQTYGDVLKTIRSKL